jgi:hypothetical protein
LARHIGEIGGGVSPGTGSSWPTPTRLDSTNTANRTAERTDPDSKHHDGVTLVDAIRRWATPSARDWRSGDASEATLERNARPLNEQATHWPTPNAVDGHNNARAFYANGGNPTLSGLAEGKWKPKSPSHPDPATEAGGPATSKFTRTSRLQLNPRFVEALMGLPPGWIDFEGSATPSCRSKPRPPCASSGTAPSENCHE